MPRFLTRGLTTLLLCVASTAPAFAAEEESGDLVKATLLADVDTISPGETFAVGVHLKMAPHWHTYWINPGESGDATKITLTGPAGLTFGEIHWPLPTKINAPGGISYGYENDVLLMVPVTVGKEISAGAPAVIDAKVSWLVCKETCIKGKANLQLSLPIGGPAKPANADLFKTWKHRLPISHESPAAREVIEKIEQPTFAEGSAGRPTLAVEWKHAPQLVEWFPISTRAVAVEKVRVAQQGAKSIIEFAPTVYKAEDLANGLVQSVLVYEDANGVRHGISMPVHVTAPK